MYSLWARKRAVNGVGSPYELIFSFDNESYKYTALNTLDGSIFQEAMVTRENDCIMYVELEKPNVKRKIRDESNRIIK
jgi:hypothetical protein